MDATEGDGAHEIGRFTFTAQEIIRFARAFDPQPFHVDAAAARRSPFGGLVASGWHTACVWMGLFVRAFGPPVPPQQAEGAGEISPVGVGFGMEDLKWPAPVRAGDTVIFYTEVTAVRPSGSRAGWSIYQRRNCGRREDGTEVISFRLAHMAPAPPGTPG